MKCSGHLFNAAAIATWTLDVLKQHIGHAAARLKRSIREIKKSAHFLHHNSEIFEV
jgi:hypothetical protein